MLLLHAVRRTLRDQRMTFLIDTWLGAVVLLTGGETDWDQLNKETGLNGAELGYVFGLWPLRGGVPFGASCPTHGRCERG